MTGHLIAGARLSTTPDGAPMRQLDFECPSITSPHRGVREPGWKPVDRVRRTVETVALAISESDPPSLVHLVLHAVNKTLPAGLCSERPPHSEGLDDWRHPEHGTAQLDSPPQQLSPRKPPWRAVVVTRHQTPSSIVALQRFDLQASNVTEAPVGPGWQIVAHLLMLHTTLHPELRKSNDRLPLPEVLGFGRGRTSVKAL